MSFSFVFCNAYAEKQYVNWMKANASAGERSRSAPETFSTGLYDIDAQAERYLLGRQHGTPSPPRSRRPTATALLTRVSQLERRFILKLKEHISWTSVIWRTAWTVDFFLHKHKVLKLARNVVGVLVHRLGIRAPWDSCTPPMLSSPTLPSCTSQPESPVSLAPCTTCGSRSASKKKVLVHGLMQRTPCLVGCSRENVFYRRER